MIRFLPGFDRPALVVSLLRGTNDELVRLLQELPPGADAVELRIDLLREPPDLPRLRGATKRPLVATARRGEEGGGGLPPWRSESERGAILLGALRAGFEWIDVEGFSPLGSAPELAPVLGRTILSFHDLEGVPADLEPRARALAGRRPIMVKIVPTARLLAEGGSAVRLQRCWAGPVPLASFAMGEAGRPTRILSPLLGGAAVWVSRSVPEETAAGQIALDDARAAYGLGASLPEVRRLFGIVALRPERSWSPRLHGPYFRRIGFPAAYLPIPVADWKRDSPALFDDSAEGFLGSGIPLEGISITAPWKERAFERGDDLSAEARGTGAANTMIRRGGRLFADNTDLPGLVALFGKLEIGAGSRAAVLGAGGAARAALLALRKVGCEPVLAARPGERSRRLSELLGVPFVPWVAGEAPPDVDLLVHATPAGADPREGSPVPASSLRAGMTVVDLVYRPGGTALVAEAIEAGGRGVDGLALLVEQGARQASLFTGRQVDPGEFAAGFRPPPSDSHLGLSATP